MGHLSTNFNNKEAWQTLQATLHRRIEVDSSEINRVIEFARRTPGLSQYEDGLQKLAVFFEVATQQYKQNNPDELSGLVEFWERYRAAVIQRYTAVTPIELRAADKVVEDIFRRFLNGVPEPNMAYSIDAVPLVYGGEGGLGAYFTHPPGWNRPFAIINLPHTAFDNVWQWLALPHEAGHDTYVAVNGLQKEIETALEERMTAAVQNAELEIPDVEIDLTRFGINYQRSYSGAEFISTIWKRWANEAQADMLGLLSCGAAAIIALQQIIGFSAKHSWELFSKDGKICDAPEEHPTSYVRNALNIAALRTISTAHNQLADEIQTRFEALRDSAPDIEWYLTEQYVIARCPAIEMVKSAEIAAQVLLTHTMQSLGNKCYMDLINFSHADQSIVDEISNRLLAGDPTFCQVDKNASARHCLAATMFAFEKDNSKMDLINRTFKQFV
ncbi:MAG: hypothetical protein GY874_00470 [Desulfobacteraceae bacterium]|nr:hypothetical protein [Desulfobacteraceae bacterium]